MLDKNVLYTLKDLYDSSSGLEKNIFAKTVQFFLNNPEATEKDYMQTLPFFGLLSDTEIKKIPDLISPFIAGKITDMQYSYGLEPYGYTARLSKEYIELNTGEKKEGLITLIRNKPILLSTLETFNFPKGICGFISNKSSWIRQGVIGVFAHIDTGFQGNLTFLFHSLSSKEIILPIGQGIAQIHFVRPSASSEGQYDGKYQDSKGVTGI